MPLPRVAIVGRPNVGKSSLLNMLAKAKVSIVDPTPGVTRDRVTTIITLEPPDGQGPARLVEIVDTGGFGAYHGEGERYDDVGNDLTRLTEDIETQIARAVGDADLVLFAVDAQAGVTPQDEEIARLLRERKLGNRQGTKARSDRGTKGEKKKTPVGKAAKGSGGNGRKNSHATVTSSGATSPPIRVIATKVDGPKWEAHALELSGLGFGEPIMCSAKNNYFRRELLEELYRTVPESDAGGPVEADTARPALKLAIVGKRNSGKSTLVNTLAGEERMIVSEIPGTTRDAVDVRFDFDGKSLVAIDTAGLRKKKAFAGPIEWYAYDRLQLSVNRADVVLLLIDATTKLSQVDEQVAMLAQKAAKPAIIVVNKWDLAAGQKNAKGKKVTSGDYEEYLRKELKGLWYAPIAFMSGATGLNVRQTIDLAFELNEQAGKRVTTGPLNRLIRGIVERIGPPSKLGTRAKVFFVAQTSVYPPTIVMVVSKPDLFTPNYQRFLLNQIREQGPFAEVPIRLVVRGKPKDAREPRRPMQEIAEGATAEELFAEDAVAAPSEAELERAAALDDVALGAEDAREFLEEPS